MKREVYSNPESSEAVKNDFHGRSAVDSVPDIDGKFITTDELISWLDRLVEVKEDADNISNK